MNLRNLSELRAAFDITSSHYTEADAAYIAAVGSITPEAWSALAEVVQAMVAIRDMEPEPVDMTVHHDTANCAECKRYEGHPISKGRCDDWFREWYAIERRMKQADGAQQWRMRDLARASIAKLDEVSR